MQICYEPSIGYHLLVALLPSRPGRNIVSGVGLESVAEVLADEEQVMDVSPPA